MTDNTNNGAPASADGATTTQAAATNATPATVPAAGEGQGQGNTAAPDTTTTPEAAQGAPEQYEAFTLPEGYVLDGERLADTTATFKELGLSQAQGQKLIDKYCKADGENAQGLRALMDVERQQRIEKWGEQTKELLGKDYDAVTANARAGVKAMESPELLEAFDAEGWGNHPALVKVFAYIGEKLVRADALNGIGGETAARPKPSHEKVLYPNMA